MNRRDALTALICLPAAAQLSVPAAARLPMAVAQTESKATVEKSLPPGIAFARYAMAYLASEGR